MIEFFTPVNIHSEDIQHNHNLYEYIDIHREHHIPDWEESEILIFDISPLENEHIPKENNTISKIRKSFYQLFPGKWNLKIADLGTLVLESDTQKNLKLIQEIISHFLLHGKHLIILGKDHALTYSIAKGISKSEKIVNCSIVDSKIDLKPEGEKNTEKILNTNFISNMLWDEEILLNNLHLIGCQAYYQPPAYLDFLRKMYIDCFSLGEIKGNINAIEPELRTSHFLSLDISSLEYAFMPLQAQPVPNGLNGVEACRLSRLSGLGTENKVLGIFGFIPENFTHGEGENLLSQIIWYYLEGKNESFLLKSLENKEEMITFHVPNNLINLKFFKQPESELWWVEINDLQIEDKIFPCSYADYKQAVSNKISERIKKIIEKNKA